MNPKLKKRHKPANGFDRSLFNVIPWDDRESIKELIIKNHYLRTWPSNVGHVKGDDYLCFGVLKNWERLVGAIVFGGPNTCNLKKSISPILEWKDVVELHRLWIEDGHGCGIESWAICQAMGMLPPYIKVVYSLADPERGHLGTIYQAANGWYQELNASNRGYRFNFTPECDPMKWTHPRSLQRTLGSPQHFNVTLAHLKGYWRKQEVEKYRYLWFLGNHIQQKKIITSLRHPISKDYPGQYFLEKVRRCPSPEWITIE